MIPQRRCRERCRDDSGSALVEVVWLGVLLLLPLIWIVVSVFEVQRGAFATSGAARSAGRAFVLADTDAQGRLRAQAAARTAFVDQGAADAVTTLDISCEPFPGRCHDGTSVVTVTVRSRVDLPLLPSILGGGAPSFPVSATHTVPVGQFQEVGGG